MSFSQRTFSKKLHKSYLSLKNQTYVYILKIMICFFYFNEMKTTFEKFRVQRSFNSLTKYSILNLVYVSLNLNFKRCI